VKTTLADDTSDNPVEVTVNVFVLDTTLLVEGVPESSKGVPIATVLPEGIEQDNPSGRFEYVYLTVDTRDELDKDGLFENVTGVIGVGGEVINVCIVFPDVVNVKRSGKTPIDIELDTTCPLEFDPTNR
jgi:hypothetical protein